MYLYVAKQQGLTCAPQELLKLFGTPAHVTTLLLTSERRLARAEITKVLHDIRERGYYLQLPLIENDEMSVMAARNSKLPR